MLLSMLTSSSPIFIAIAVAIVVVDRYRLQMVPRIVITILIFYIGAATTVDVVKLSSLCSLH